MPDILKYQQLFLEGIKGYQLWVDACEILKSRTERCKNLLKINLNIQQVIMKEKCLKCKCNHKKCFKWALLIKSVLIKHNFLHIVCRVLSTQDQNEFLQCKSQRGRLSHVHREKKAICFYLCELFLTLGWSQVHLVPEQKKKKQRQGWWLMWSPQNCLFFLLRQKI